MGYATLWLIGFGVLFTGYLMTAGFDYGVGILLPFVTKDDDERRLGLNAVGPFLLSNEVWLIIALGMLIGTLPGFESRLLDGAYPLAVIAVVGAILTVVSVLLRSRSANTALRKFWDALIFVGGVFAAFGWGAVTAVLAAGVDLGTDGKVLTTAGSFAAFPVLAGLTMVALMGSYGGAFLTGRTDGPVAERAAKFGTLLGWAAAVLLVLTVLTGWLGGALSGALARPAVTAVLVVIALAAIVYGQLRRAAGQAWQGFWATAVAIGLLPLSVFIGKFPQLITSHSAGAPQLPTSALADNPLSLEMITWFAGPVLLIVIGVQVWSWFAFRGKVTRGESAWFF
jgi:cytochrome bd ubiquinol oxidase subunit II